MTEEPDSGKTSAVVDGVAEEMKRQRVSAARSKDTATFFSMKSVWDLSARRMMNCTRLAAAASSMALKSLSQNKRNHEVHTHRECGNKNGCGLKLGGAANSYEPHQHKMGGGVKLRERTVEYEHAVLHGHRPLVVRLLTDCKQLIFSHKSICHR